MSDKQKLIAVHKDGTTLNVHPTTVANHKELGWVETGETCFDVDTINKIQDAINAGTSKPVEELDMSELIARAEILGLNVDEQVDNGELVKMIKIAEENAAKLGTPDKQAANKSVKK